MLTHTFTVLVLRRMMRHAALSSVRHLNAVGVLLVTCWLAGCSSIRLPPSDIVSRRGGQATLVQRWGFAYRVHTASVAPGDTRSAAGPWTLLSCQKYGISVKIYSSPDVPGSKASLCRGITEGIHDVSQRVGISGIHVNLKIYLVPEGRKIRSKWGAWSTSSSANMTYMLPWSLEDEIFARANVISSTAHESFHLLAALAGRPKKIYMDEPTAYLAGACAQFNAIGVLRLKDLPEAAMDRDEHGVDESLIRSSIAGSSLRVLLSPLFPESGYIYSNTMAAQGLEKFCTLHVDDMTTR